MSDFEQIESSQRQFHNEKEHYEKMCTQAQIAEYNLFSMLKPEIKKDGNQWCVLYGKDLQEGITGFGDTPYSAILDWNSQWVKK